MRPAYCRRRPLLATGAARNRVSSAGQSSPSPAYGPVATASSGGPPGSDGKPGKSGSAVPGAHAAPEDDRVVPEGAASAIACRWLVQLVRTRQFLPWLNAAAT